MDTNEKERLDTLLFKKGLYSSREKARASIEKGLVSVGGITCNKPGLRVNTASFIVCKGEAVPYVSRGGLKLEKALDVFGIVLDGLTALDAGASTGGFTQCMLQRGAKRVYSVDVGHGQLDKTLLSDSRVVSLEGRDIRTVTVKDVDEVVDFVSIDVSFISLTKVLPSIKELINKNADVVCLIKPQFEAGKGNVGKKGVVKSRSIHAEVISGIIGFAKETGFSVPGLDYSPVKGSEGNIEYLAHLRMGNNGNYYYGNGKQDSCYDIIKTVNNAWDELVMSKPCD